MPENQLIQNENERKAQEEIQAEASAQISKTHLEQSTAAPDEEAVPVLLSSQIDSAAYIYGLQAGNPDQIIKKKGRRFYKEMARKDGKIGSQLRIRRLFVSKCKWSIQPAGDDDLDVEKANLVKYVLANIVNSFQTVINDMLYAPRDGFRLSEIVWDSSPNTSGPYPGKWGINRIKAKPSDQVDFIVDDKLNLIGVVSTKELVAQAYTTLDQNLLLSGVNVQVISPRKFIHVIHEQEDENPYGRSVLHELAWPYEFKKSGRKYWAVFMERFGSPTVVWKRSGKRFKGLKNDAEKKDYKEKAQNIINTIQQLTGIVIDIDESMELLESVQQGWQGYGKYCEYIDREISESITGQSLATGSGGRQGIVTASIVHMDIFKNLILADKSMIEFALNDAPHALVRQIVDTNYPETENYPRFMFDREKEDLDKVIKRVEAALNKKLPVGKDYYYNELGIPRPKEGDEVIEFDNAGVIKQQAEEEVAKFAEASDKKFLARSLNKVDKVVDDFAVPRFTAEVIKIRDLVADRVAQKKIIEKKNFKAVKNVANFLDFQDLKTIVANSLLFGYLSGAETSLDLMRANGFEANQIRFAENDPFSEEEAFRIFKDKVPMTRKEFRKLTDELKENAFTLGGIEEQKIVNEVHQALYNTLANEGTLEDFRQALGEGLVKYTGTVFGQAAQAAAELTPFHVETIFRTNVLKAYHQGQDKMYFDQSVGDFILGFEHFFVDDTRVRDDHRRLGGVTLAKNDPLYQKYKYPLSYNCRCDKLPIFKTSKKKIIFTPHDKAAELYAKAWSW